MRQGEAYKRKLIAHGKEIKELMEGSEIAPALRSKLDYLVGFIEALDIEAIDPKK